MLLDSYVWARSDLLWCFLMVAGFLACGVIARCATAVGFVIALAVQAAVQGGLAVYRGWAFPIMDLPLFIIFCCTWALAAKRIARKNMPERYAAIRIVCLGMALLCFVVAVCLFLGAPGENGAKRSGRPHSLETLR